MSENEEKKKALIISVSDYENLENLDFCKNDGEIMYDTLTRLGYEIPYGKNLIGLVPDVKIKKAIVDFFRTTSNDASDTLLFYYSGHGVLDGYEGRYFATSNINSQFPEENGIAFEFLTQQMDRSTSRRTIAVIDCCFSGSAVPGVTGKGANAEIEAEMLGREALSKQFKNSKGKCVLASSLSQRRSYNLPDKKMSAFTHFIVEGLKGNKEAVDKDGYVTPEKLDEYVFSELSKFKELAQTPVRNLSISGRLTLAYYPDLAQTEQSTTSKADVLSILKQKPSEQRSRAVGFIKQSDHNISTVFLIGPNLIMTDRDVLPTKESASLLSVMFGNKTEDETLKSIEISQGIPEPKNKSFELDPSNIFITSELGYSIISTKGTPGNDYGWIKLSSYKDAIPKSLLFSIYFSQNHKIIDDENNFLLIGEGSFNKIIFESEALEMTTGAPIFDKNWNLLSMHIGKSGFIFTMTNSIFEMRISKQKREGIRIIAVVQELESFCKKQNQMACDILKFSG